MLTYVKPELLSVKRHAELDEAWVQARIAEDPTILGLGDLILKDKERAQPRAGRLDLLLQHAEEAKRFEVEVQLGPTDEAHIIRCIEYWDIERKRYPQYDHTAVLVAEDITSRFLNVISLLNGTIPLVAIQMSALKIGEQVALTFTTVLDVLPLGLVDEDEEVAEATDRAYWLQRGTKESVGTVDELLLLAQAIEPGLSLKYNKFYVGLTRGVRPNNFVVFRPQKKGVKVDVKLSRSDDVEADLEAAGLDLIDYDAREGRYRLRLTKGDVQKHHALLTRVLQQAYEEFNA